MLIDQQVHGKVVVAHLSLVGDVLGNGEWQKD